MADKNRRWRDKRRAEGKCENCGRPKDRRDRTNCERCRQAKNQQKARGRESRDSRQPPTMLPIAQALGIREADAASLFNSED